MSHREDKVMTFEKWAEDMSREIFLLDEERPNVLSKLYDIFGDDFENDFEDEEFTDSWSNKK